jgi:hypothetical protein
VLEKMTAWNLDPTRLAEAGVREVKIRKYEGENPDSLLLNRRFLLNESGQPTDFFALRADGSEYEHFHNEWNGEVLTSVEESQPTDKYRKTDFFYTRGRLDSTCDTQDHCREFLYDQRDSLIGILAGRKNGYRHWKIKRAYDEQGRRICDSLIQSWKCKVVDRYTYDMSDRIAVHTTLIYRDTVEDWAVKSYLYDGSGLLQEQQIEEKDRIPYRRIYLYDDQGRMVEERTYGIGKKRPQKYTRWCYREDGRQVEKSDFHRRKKKPGVTEVETFREDGLPEKNVTRIGKKYWIIHTYEYGVAQ